MATRRNYVTIAEVEQFADVTSEDNTEFEDRIRQAEEMIDAYVGFQQKFMRVVVKGRCSNAGGGDYFYLDSNQLSVYQKDYFKWCEVEITGGTGEGQRRIITTSEFASGKITVAANWDDNPDATSFFRIYQLGKFPRKEDVDYYTDSSPFQYYKQIPEAVKRAVAAQVEFLIEMGDAYFAGDKTQKESERIGNYSYSRAKGAGNLARLIAPKARLLLKAVRNRTGEMV